MPVQLEQEPVISEGDVDMVAIDYTPYLDSGELLTGTVTVTHVSGPATPTFANNAVNTASVVILGKTVAIGKAVQFKVSGQTASTSTPYYADITVSTNSTPARTVKRRIKYWCS